MLVADSSLLTPNGTFFAELIAFILMILILGKYAYPRIIKAATEREDKIEQGFALPPSPSSDSPACRRRSSRRSRKRAPSTGDHHPFARRSNCDAAE